MAVAAVAAAPLALLLGAATGLGATFGAPSLVLGSAAVAAVVTGLAFTFVAGIGAAWLPVWRRDAPWLRPAASAAMPMALTLAFMAPIVSFGPGAIISSLQLFSQIHAAQQAAGPGGGFPPTIAPTTYTEAQAAAGRTQPVTLGSHVIHLPIRPGWRYQSGAVRATQMVIVRSEAPGERAQLSLTAYTRQATRAMLEPGCEATETGDAKVAGSQGLETTAITFAGRPCQAAAYERGGSADGSRRSA